MKLNLGCGAHTPDGWVNVDYAWGARLARVPFFSALNRKFELFKLDWNTNILLHDLRKKLPWPDETVDVVYSSHTLEHFTRDEGRQFIGECCRVLRRGGIVRLVVPDLRYIVGAYLEGRIRADAFVERLGVLYETRGSELRDKLAPFIQFPHKCMYDALTLLEVVNQLGFDAVIKAPFESQIADIQRMELEERIKNAVIVEGRKR